MAAGGTMGAAAGGITGWAIGTLPGLIIGIFMGMAISKAKAEQPLLRTSTTVSSAFRRAHGS